MAAIQDPGARSPGFLTTAETGTGEAVTTGCQVDRHTAAIHNVQTGISGVRRTRKAQRLIFELLDCDIYKNDYAF